MNVDDGKGVAAGRCGNEDTPPPRDEKWESLGLVSKARYVCKNCTVEPILGFFIMTTMLNAFATQNLNLQKACRVNLRLDDDICTALESRNSTSVYRAQEIAVQSLVADMMVWKMVIQSTFQSALLLFMGSWSDRNKKRIPCMLLPVVGELVASVGYAFCAYLFYELPLEFTVLVDTLPGAMTGGWWTMLMAVYSYISDVSSVEYRTLRIGITSMIFSVGITIGTALSGVLMQKVGIFGIYSIAIVLNLLTVIYGIVFVEEVKASTINTECCKEPLTKSTSGFHFFNDFFKMKHIKEAFKVTFKKGKQNRRMKMVLLMVAIFVIWGPLQGEMSMMYLYTRLKFNWNEVDYSVFATYSMITNCLGSMFSIGVFSQKLKIHDALIGLMSCLSKILAGFVYTFATTGFEFYMAALVEIINGTSITAMRSIISKIVPSDELGQVNSIFGVFEAFVPVVYGPMYSIVYKATLKTYPGTFFIVGNLLTIPAVLIFIWLYKENKKVQGEKGAVVTKDPETDSEKSQQTKSIDTKLS